MTAPRERSVGVGLLVGVLVCALPLGIAWRGQKRAAETAYARGYAAAVDSVRAHRAGEEFDTLSVVLPRIGKPYWMTTTLHDRRIIVSSEAVKP